MEDKGDDWEISIENYRLFLRELLRESPKEWERAISYLGMKEIKLVENIGNIKLKGK